MTHDPFIVQDALAIIGALCLLCTLAVIAWIAWDCWQQDRANARRAADRADWSSGRRAL